MTFDRRAFLGGSGAAVAASWAGVGSATIAQPVHTVLDGIAAIALRHSPETLAKLGLDKGVNQWAKSRLNDRSWAERNRTLAEIPRCMQLLAKLRKTRLSQSDRRLCAAVEHALSNGAEGRLFDYGGAGSYGTIGTFGGGIPYVVSQQDGAYLSVPALLKSYHSISNESDANAYVARLSEFAVVLDQENERVTRDAALGVVAPTFILETVLAQLTTLRSSPRLQSALLAPLTQKTASANIPGDWQGRAARVVEKSIAPALDRQIMTMRKLRESSTPDAGVWKLPKGDEYYAWLLDYGTSTTLSPEEVHQLGIQQGQALDARLDVALQGQGLTGGTVGERLAALTADPRQLFENNDKGRAQLLSYAGVKIKQLRALMPRVSRLTMKAELVVERVPPEIEAGASLAYADFASLDGTRPATYYINLRDTSNWPKFTVPSTSAHEGLPGHAWQGAYAAEHRAEVPLIHSLVDYNAWGEGWAVYSEELVDELGFYDDDPFGRIGMLQALRFRASRLVVDTGIHVKRWPRVRAIDYMVSTTGRARPACTSEVDRYCVAPGTACGYKIGHTEIMRLRDRAKRALGARFDVRDFNDTIIQAGSVPLNVLGIAIDEWIAASR